MLSIWDLDVAGAVGWIANYGAILVVGASVVEQERDRRPATVRPLA